MQTKLSRRSLLKLTDVVQQFRRTRGVEGFSAPTPNARMSWATFCDLAKEPNRLPEQFRRAPAIDEPPATDLR